MRKHGDPEKGNPQETVLGGEVSRGFDSASRLTGRLERYGTAKGRAVDMVAHLSEKYTTAQPGVYREKLRRLKADMGECGNYLHFRNYYTVDQVKLHAANFCKVHLLCPLCAIRRGAKMLKAYLDRYLAINCASQGLKPYLVTLTVKNGDDLAERFAHLRSSLKTLKDRRRDYMKKGRGWTEFAKAEGVVGSYEFTNRGKGWHPHVHMICLCKSPPCQETLSQEWHSITGDSFIVDVRPFQEGQEPAEAFLEVFKYAVKFSDLSLADNYHAFETLAGKRLLFSLGLFRNVEVPEDLLDEPLDDLPFVDLFYRYFDKLGYQFTPSLQQSA